MTPQEEYKAKKEQEHIQRQDEILFGQAINFAFQDCKCRIMSLEGKQELRELSMETFTELKKIRKIILGY